MISDLNTSPDSRISSENHADNKGSSSVDLLVMKMKGTGDFPAISKYISEINEKASHRSKTSATQLANVIIKDYSLTTKLLKMVNSALYGQFSGQIATISRAVVILGFEQVRMAATGLLFLEYMQNKSQAAEIKKTILISFLSSVLARELAIQLEISNCEEVFVCSMLHNLGKLLMMNYFHEEYEKVNELRENNGLSEPKAVLSVFDVTYDELGMAVAKAWGLPQKIVKSLESLPEKELQKKGGQIDPLRSLACFSNELYIITTGDNTPNDKKRLLHSLLKKFDKVIPFSAKKIEELVSITTEKTKSFSLVLGIDRLQKDMLNSISLSSAPKAEKVPVSEQKVIEQPSDFFELDNALAKESLSASPQKTLKKDQQIIILTSIQEVTQAILDASTDLDDVINMVTETIFRGLGFSRVLIGIKDPRTNTINGRYGLGDYLEEILRKFCFSIQESSDIFNMAVSTGKDMFIHDSDDPTIKANIPDWYRGLLKSQSFVLYPLMVNDNCIGLIYADMKGTGEIIATEKLSYLKMLRDQVVLAIKQK